MIQLTHVTHHNIDDVSEGLPTDQRNELQVGCITIRYMSGNVQHLTCWPEERRAAFFDGGDSAWGDYTGTPGTDEFRFIPDLAPGLS